MARKFIAAIAAFAILLQLAAPAAAQTAKVQSVAGLAPSGVIASISGASLSGSDLTFNAAGQSVVIDASGAGGLSFTLQGAWSGTLKVQWSDKVTGPFQDGTAAYAGGTDATSITANQQYTAPAFGRYAKITTSAWSSGSATVTPTLWTQRPGGASSGGGGGGGGGGPTTLADGADTAQGSTGDAAWSGTGSATLISIQKAIRNLMAGTLTVALPSGASTAANQTTGNTSLASIDTKLSSQATAANQATMNGKLDQLHTDMTAATPAGEAHIGKVAGELEVVGGSFTTPSGTGAYTTTNNLIANSATAGSVAPVQLQVCRLAAGRSIVRRIRVKTADTGFAGKQVIVHLYRDAPTFTNGDHSSWLSTESNWLGDFTITLDHHFSDFEKGMGGPDVGSEVNLDCASGSQVIYAVPTAGETITPQGAKAWTIVAEAYPQ